MYHGVPRPRKGRRHPMALSINAYLSKWSGSALATGQIVQCGAISLTTPSPLKLLKQTNDMAADLFPTNQIVRYFFGLGRGDSDLY